MTDLRYVNCERWFFFFFVVALFVGSFFHLVVGWWFDRERMVWCCVFGWSAPFLWWCALFLVCMISDSQYNSSLDAIRCAFFSLSSVSIRSSPFFLFNFRHNTSSSKHLALHILRRILLSYRLFTPFTSKYLWVSIDILFRRQRKKNWCWTFSETQSYKSQKKPYFLCIVVLWSNPIVTPIKLLNYMYSVWRFSRQFLFRILFLSLSISFPFVSIANTEKKL